MRRSSFMIVAIVAALIVAMALPLWAGAQKEKKVTITVPTVLGWVTTDGVIPIVAAELAKEGIEVKTMPAENITLRDKQMMEGRQGSSVYDVYIAWEALMPLMKDFLEPVDTHLQAAGQDPVAFRKLFYQAVQDQIMYDGKMYWIPIHVNSQLGYARPDLFNDAKEKAAFRSKYGYDLPAPDAAGSLTFKDANQFLDVAKFFTRDLNGDGQTDLWGYDQPGKWDHGNCVFEEILLRSGLEYFDPQGHSLWGPAHPENQKLVRDIATWESNTTLVWKITSPGALGMEMTEVNQMFTEGKGAMSFTWNVDFWGVDSKGDFAKKYGKPLSWSISFVNRAPQYKGIMSIWGYALNKNSKNKEAAVKFLMKLADANLRKEAHRKANLPCPNGMVEVTEWAVKEGYAPAAFIDAVQSVGSFWPISKKAWPETEPVRDVCRKAREELLAGKISPAEFVKTTGDKIEKIMKDAGYF
jgi:ABC-type glycerol-3-phosphate transport system substrate-binding protein